jgi:GGDEF domain-containing protein
VAFCDRSQLTKSRDITLFAQRVVDDLLNWSRALHDYVRRPGLLPHSAIKGLLPQTVTSVIVIRFINYETLRACHGQTMAEGAMQCLVTMMRASMRRDDTGILINSTEYLVALQDDTQVASRLASRLVAKASHIVLLDARSVPLPHLQVVAGITASLPGEAVRSAYARACESAMLAASGGLQLGRMT